MVAIDHPLQDRLNVLVSQGPFLPQMREKEILDVQVIHCLCLAVLVTDAAGVHLVAHENFRDHMRIALQAEPPVQVVIFNMQIEAIASHSQGSIDPES
jgi:hypothetical protein